MKKLYLILAASLVAVMAQAQAELYVVGATQGSPGNATVITLGSDGFYTYEASDWSKVSIINGSDWNEFNSGCLKSAGAPNGARVQTQTIKLTKGDGNMPLPYEGTTFTYQIKEDLSEVIVAGKQAPEGYSHVYVRGNMNSWSASDDWEMETNDGIIYILKNKNVTQGQSFKIADGSYASVNFGYSNTFKLDEVITCSYIVDGGDMTIPETKTGVTFSINISTGQFMISTDGSTVEGVEEDPDAIYNSWYVNAFGYWNDGDSYNGGIQPVSAIATFEEKVISNQPFGIKVWDTAKDTYYTASSPIPVNTWTTLSASGDTYIKAMTVEGATEGAAYTIQYNVKTNEIYLTPTSIQYPEKLYLIGTIPDHSWDPSYGLEAIGNNGVYTFENITLNDNGGAAFSFATQLGSDNNDWNLGVRYGANDIAMSQVDISESGKAYDLVMSNNPGSFAGIAGTYTIVVNLQTMTMTANWNIPSTLNIIGNINGNSFVATSTQAMSQNETGIFTIENIAITGADDLGFGYIAFCENQGSEWIDLGTRYGATVENDQVVMTVPGVQTKKDLSVGGSNYSFKVPQGFYDITVNLQAMEVIFEYAEVSLSFGVDSDDTWSQSGKIEGYDINITAQNSEDKKFAYLYVSAPEGTTAFYSISQTSGVQLNSISEEIMPLDLSVEEGYSEVPEVDVNEFTKTAVKLANPSSGTISFLFAKEINNVTVQSTPVKYTYSVNQGTPTGIDGVEAADDTEAVFYNLHGVKVVSPDRGIFIKVQNGKAEKVVL